MPHRTLEVLGRACAIAAETSAEDRLLHRLVHCARDAAAADFCAIYLVTRDLPEGKGNWRLGASSGGDPHLLESFPASYGHGPSVLACLLDGGHELYEKDLLDGAPEDAPLPPGLPARSLMGVPLRRQDGRAFGALLAGRAQAGGFETAATTSLRAIAHLLAVAIDNARLAAAQQRERRITAQSAMTLDGVLESVGSGVCVLDLDGTVRIANQAMHKLFGIEARSSGLPQEEVFRAAPARPVDLDGFLARLRTMLAEPAQVDESEWELATEPPRIVQRHAAPLRTLLGEVIGRVEVYTDVTEGRRLYAQLLHSEKLRAIGEMASGLAHDFNNLLAAIVGQTELLRPEDQPPATQHALATIRLAALDGARMIRNLQDYTRKHGGTSGVIADLDEAVRVAVEMARPRWAGAVLRGGGAIDVRVEQAASDGPGPQIAIDPTELREVLLNLLFNAADAMPDGGRIDIRARVDRDGWAEIIVRDTGTGMSEAVRGRIFEPFFSTKGAGGSGLGLAVVYSIITRHGGQINAESAIGEGTTFLIRLPLAPGSRPEPSALSTTGVQESPASAQALAGTRLLVVDDEPRLRAVVRQMLEDSGAVVDTAADGQAAIGLLQDSGLPFDAVVTDLDMPGLDGWAVARAAKAAASHRPVIMVTGWAGQIAPEELERRGIDALLAKPCRREELEETISAFLARDPLSGPRGGGLRILLAEDDRVFAATFSDVLSMQGHHVVLVNSVSAAFAALATGRYDVLLTDYRLGDMTGQELAAHVAEFADAPMVVLVTGYATQVDDPALLTRGVDAVLPKPCRPQELHAVLARAARRAPRSQSQGVR